MKKPSEMPRTGKQHSKPKKKAEQAADKLGGISGKAVDSIRHEQQIKKQFLDDIMKDL